MSMSTTKKRKHLSSIANDVLHRCALRVDTEVDALVEEFEAFWKPEMGEYSRKLVEFCSSRALTNVCCKIEEMISDGSFSRLTFDMMLAWEIPSSEQEESHQECMGKEKEERKIAKPSAEDEISLFYSDLMPLLVDNEPSVGEDAFVWFGSLVPLVVDMVNGRFTFETLTAPTGNRLHYPAYDKYLKEIDNCMRQLQKHTTPNGVELADDEFILHVEGTASTQRVVRHIGGTSWPGRLTLTNYAAYFEASAVVSYEDAIKLDLSKDVEQAVKPVSTGPWGAPLFDKAISYESTDLKEPVVLEFPEMTSATRRDHWLALMKEIMLLHQFLLRYKLESPTQKWEMHARTIFGIIRLHAARELLRMSPPEPKSFLIFALFDELPKGDYVLEVLAESLKKVDSANPCSASSTLRCMNVSQLLSLAPETDEGGGGERRSNVSSQPEDFSSLENAVEQAREEAIEVNTAKATAEGLKEEGITDSTAVLMELLKPLRNLVPWFQEIIRWERPVLTIVAMVTSLLVVYNEWVGKALAAFLLGAVAHMLRARFERIGNRYKKIVVCTGSDQTTIESIVSAQHGLKFFNEVVQVANIALLKIWSILVSKAPKHTDMVIMAMTGAAIVLAVVPFKYMLIALIVYIFATSSKPDKRMSDKQGNRRLKEWWDSIPVIPVEVLDKVPGSET